MNRSFPWLLAAAMASLSAASHATTSDTDELRAAAAKLTAAANHAAAVRPFVASDPEVIVVSDTDTARRAAAQATARQAHAQYMADMLRAGAGIRPAPIKVMDTDSARLAAAQEHRERRLLADYAEYMALR